MNVAVVGCGRMGAFGSSLSGELPNLWGSVAHAESILVSQYLNLVALVEQDNTKHELLRSKFDCPVYDDIRLLFKNHSVDILTIATRTPVKLELIEAAYEAGIRSFHIEKPLLTSRNQIPILRKFLENCTFSYGCLRSHIDLFRNINKVAKYEDLGDLRYVQVQMGAGLLLWTMTHAVDYLLVHGGLEVDNITARFNDFSVSDQTIHEDPVLLHAQIHFATGVIGEISPIPGNSFVHVYENGVLRIRHDGHKLEMEKFSQCGYPVTRELNINHYFKDTGSTLKALESHIALRELIGRDTTELDRAIRGHEVMFAMAESHLNRSLKIEVQDSKAIKTILGIHNGLYA